MGLLLSRIEMLPQRTRCWSVDKRAPTGAGGAPHSRVPPCTNSARSLTGWGIPTGTGLRWPAARFGYLPSPAISICSGGAAHFMEVTAKYKGAQSPAKTKSNTYFEFLICLLALCVPKKVWPTPKECIFRLLINHSETRSVLVKLWNSYSERGAGARSLLDGSERFDQGYVLGITDNVKDGDAYLELINCPNF